MESIPSKMIDFRELLPALQAHPNILVIRAQILPGASPAAIAEAEAQLGVPLHPAIKAFYMHHNGLAIEWVYKPAKRFPYADYKVDDPELPFLLDLLNESIPPRDGTIIFVPIEEVFVESYEAIKKHSDFAPEVAYMEYFEEPQEPNQGSFTFRGRQFASEAAFRSQLRLFEGCSSDRGSLLWLESGKSDPDLLYVEDPWHNFHSDQILPAVLTLSQYMHHVAYDFGLCWQRDRYFNAAEPVPVNFDPKIRLDQLIAETKLPGHLKMEAD